MTAAETTGTGGGWVETGPQDEGGRGLRTAFGRFPSGVVALCARQPEQATPIGMAASSFTSLSLEPPLVLVCMARSSTTWPQLRSMPRLGVSVLGEAHDTVVRQLAARAGDRFAGLGLESTSGGAVLVHGASAWLDCSLEDELPGGDHTIAVLRVHAHRLLPEHAPLVFHDSGFGKVAP